MADKFEATFHGANSTPVRSAEGSANPYTEGYWERGEGSNYHGYGDDPGWGSIAGVFRDHMGPSRGQERMLLEVGCAGGYFVRQARSVGFNARGIDLSPYAINQAPEDAADFVGVGTATDLTDWATGSLDVVCSWEMLEHLDEHQILFALVEMHRVLTPGGLMVHKIALGTDGVAGYEQIPFHDAHGDATHITLNTPEWWHSLLNTPHDMTRAHEVEDDLNAAFVGRDWHNRFFAYRKGAS